MKLNLLKKAVCLTMCMCLLGLAGCGGTDSSTNKKHESGSISEATVAEESSSSTASATTTTTTTSATTTTTTTATTLATKTEKPSSSVSVVTTTTTKKQSNDDPNVEKLVAITFDDGPYSPVTERILDTLEKYGAKATFFVVGDRVATYKSTLKRASDLGCEIGSHTWSHKILTKISEDEIRSEISQADTAITNVTGKRVKIMRPPGGAVNDAVRKNVHYPMIMWNVDSLDWKNRNAQMNYDNVVNDVSDGSIILMHDLYSATADAVEKIIPDLMKKGYKFVTVSELMTAKGIVMENGKKYSCAR